MIEDTIEIEPDIKVHSFILREHADTLRELRERTHNLKSMQEGLSLNVQMMQKDLSEIKVTQSEIANNLEKINELMVKMNLITKAVFSLRYIIFGLILSLLGTHFSEVKQLMGIS